MKVGSVQSARHVLQVLDSPNLASNPFHIFVVLVKQQRSSGLLVQVSSQCLQNFFPKMKNDMMSVGHHESWTCSPTHGASPTYRWSASTSHAGVCVTIRKSERTSSPRVTWLQPLPLHLRGKSPTASATLDQTFSAGGKVAREP